MTETITFNVGGHKYEVSKSLFELQYPYSMLAKSASDQWHEDPESEIFIELDGSLFAYALLSLIRDQKVTLPLSVSKKAFLDELRYYGVEVGNKAQGVLHSTAVLK